MILPNDIRKRIEVRFGSAIRYSKDCDGLSLHIARSCKQQISVTTLKRLFGFAKSVTKPRRYTYDTIAEYLGYENWTSLENELQHSFTEQPSSNPYDQFDIKQNEAIYLLSQFLNNAKTTGVINKKKVAENCRRFAGSEEICSHMMALANVAATQNDVGFLTDVFDLPYLFDETKQDKGRIYYMGQAIGQMLRSHPELSEQLIPHYGKNPRAQKYLVEWFVDEDFLQGYYGKLLEVYHEDRNKKTQDLIFYYCLKHLQAWKVGNIVLQKDLYLKISSLPWDRSIHPIPLARMMAILIHQEAPPKPILQSLHFKKICDYVSGLPYDIVIAFYLYLLRDLYRFQHIDWLELICSLFDKQFKDPSKEEKSHWGLKVENQLWIYRSIAYHSNGGSAMAEQLFSHIDPELFDIFMAEQIEADYASLKQLLKSGF